MCACQTKLLIKEPNFDKHKTTRHINVNEVDDN